MRTRAAVAFFCTVLGCSQRQGDLGQNVPGDQREGSAVPTDPADLPPYTLYFVGFNDQQSQALGLTSELPAPPVSQDQLMVVAAATGAAVLTGLGTRGWLWGKAVPPIPPAPPPRPLTAPELKPFDLKPDDIEFAVADTSVLGRGRQGIEFKRDGQKGYRWVADNNQVMEILERNSVTAANNLQAGSVYHYFGKRAVPDMITLDSSASLFVQPGELSRSAKAFVGIPDDATEVAAVLDNGVGWYKYMEGGREYRAFPARHGRPEVYEGFAKNVTYSGGQRVFSDQKLPAPWLEIVPGRYIRPGRVTDPDLVKSFALPSSATDVEVVANDRGGRATYSIKFLRDGVMGQKTGQETFYPNASPEQIMAFRQKDTGLAFFATPQNWVAQNPDNPLVADLLGKKKAYRVKQAPTQSSSTTDSVLEEAIMDVFFVE